MSANIVSVSAGAATGWFSEGWRLFTKSWLTWLIGAIAVFVLMIILNLIPVIGQIISMFAQATLAVAIMIAIGQLDVAGSINWGTVVEQLKTKLVPIVILTLINFGLALLMGVIIGFVIAGGAVAAGSLSGADGSGAGMMAVGGGLFAMVITFLFAIVMTFLNYFTAPIVAFTNASAIDAMKASIQGCTANMLPLLVFGVIAFILAVIAIIPLGLGMLLLGPVLAGAWYTSAKQIFPGVVAGQAPSTSAAQPA